MGGPLQGKTLRGRHQRIKAVLMGTLILLLQIDGAPSDATHRASMCRISA
jgi:hypothetical protein